MEQDNPQARHLFLFDEYALFVGTISDTSVHAHYSVQVCVGLDGPFELWSAEGWQECAAAIVPSNVPHALRVSEARILLLYLDPVTTPGRQVTARCADGRVQAFPAGEVAEAIEDVKRHLQAGCDASVAKSVTQRLRTVFSPEAPATTPVDLRIQQVLLLLDGEDADAWQLPRLAAHVNLSPDRLRHLFREQLGISIRSYKSWARLRLATTLLAHGGSLTEIAHGANFADAAHLSRAFREMFGVTPSELAGSHIELH